MKNNSNSGNLSSGDGSMATGQQNRPTQQILSAAPQPYDGVEQAFEPRISVSSRYAAQVVREVSDMEASLQSRPSALMDNRPVVEQLADRDDTDEREEIYDGEEPGEPCVSDCVCECEAPSINLKSSRYSFREFSVKPLNHGFIIKAGCHQFAIETKERLAQVLSEYVLNHNSKEGQWWDENTI